MAERRMFTKKITDGDAFTAMPPTTQCLYFHLCMSADDDGFSNNIRIAMFNAHATADDFNMLVNKKFIIPFDSGVIVIKHWKMHNYIQNDRYHETKFVEEKAKLLLKDNGVYKLDTECIQNGYKMDTEVRLGKVSIDKNSIDKASLGKESVEPAPAKPKKHKHGEYGHVLVTDDELTKLFDDFGETDTTAAIKYLDEYIEMKGTKYKSHYLAMRKWVFDAVKEKAAKKPSGASIADEWLNALED